MKGWTTAREQQAVALWSQGCSAQKIADEIGNGISRNAVIGKIGRLGLRRGQKAHAVRAGKSSPRVARPKVISRSDVPSPGARSQVYADCVNLSAARHPFPQAGEGVLAESLSNDSHDATVRAVLALTPPQCRWPLAAGRCRL